METLILFGIGAGAVVLFRYFSEERRVKRRIRKTPAFALGDLLEAQEARVIGQAVVLHEHLVGPLSGRACVAYTAKVEQNLSGDGNGFWQTLVIETRIVPFVLEDGTGRAIVDGGAAARVALGFDSNSTSSASDDPTAVERAFLERHGARDEGWVFTKRLRYREAIIAIGETISVLGSGTREPDPQAAPADYRGGQPTLIRLTSSPRYPLVISDDPSTTRRD
jgi:hypothetical protein